MGTWVISRLTTRGQDKRLYEAVTFLPLKALLEIGSVIITLIPDLEMLLVSLFSVWALVLPCLCKYFCNRTVNTSEGEI